MKKKNLIRAPRLIPGDTIAVLAPASPFEKGPFEQGVTILKSMGFNIYLPPGLFLSKGYLAGEDSHRSDLLNNAFKFPEIKAIMCARGGYGSARILEKIDYEQICKNPKIFIGFSDISALLASLYDRCGLVTFHGPTVASLSDANQETVTALFNAITSQKVLSFFEPNATVLKPGFAKGPIIGGNLTTLCHLIGTLFEPVLENCILFLEDCNEAPYRIDRMLTHMKMAGWFEKLSGMILGNFSECGKNKEVWEVFEDHLADCYFPILAGFSIGHQGTNLTLPFGLEATLNADEKYLCYHEPSTVTSCSRGLKAVVHQKTSPGWKGNKNFAGINKKDNQIDQLMIKALEDFVFPGAVLLFAKNSSILFHKAYGITNVFTDCPVKLETFFDLASLTKPLATATSIMALVRDRKLGIEDSLGAVITEFKYSEKKNIRIDQLLTHTSGLPDYLPFFKKLQKFPAHETKKELRKFLLEVPLKNPMGLKILYSDLGFMILEWVIERVAGCSIDKYVKNKIYDPLGLDNLFYQDINGQMRDVSYAATEICGWRNKLIEGVVHDENAFVAGGIGGHAGLFGTAEAVYQLLDHMLQIYRNPSFKGMLETSLVQKFFERYQGLGRTLGFDTPSDKNSSAGHLFSSESIGHLGFTGTSFWMDLNRSIVIILLTNRIHPDRSNQKLKGFRPLLHDAIMCQI